ncbi:Alpha/beta hydrolase fold-1 [Trametes meyenii]|nr:Alpha/beta hydrolase fold-1 [Trametes meyenii]
MESKSYLFDPRPVFPLLVTARQYWTADCARDDPDALTLVFAHATGYHKEHWEPTIEHLFALARDSKNVKIRDAWCIDAPNHGEAAKLNEKKLQWSGGYVPIFPWEEYARAVHLFLAGLGKGVDVDFSTRKLVGIGHSMGATAVILSHTYQPQLPYVSAVLVDPMLIAPKLDTSKGNSLAAGAEKRRDIWPSRTEALALFRSRPAWKDWDPRVLALYIEHGMRDLPTAEYPDKTEGVTLTCTKVQEVASFSDRFSQKKAYGYLSHFGGEIPLHFIFADPDIPNVVPEIVRETMVTDGTKGKHTSVQRVRGAGHLIPQTQPEGLANALWATLISDQGVKRGLRSRL